MIDVVLYGKPGCCLCDDARAALVTASISFRQVDINSDPALKAEYGWTIPVVEVSGILVFEAGMDPQDLARLVLNAAGP